MQRLDIVGTLTGLRFGVATAELELVAGGTAAVPVITALNWITRETVTLTPAPGVVPGVPGFAVHSGARVSMTVDGVAGSILPEAIAQARALGGAASVGAFLGSSAPLAAQAVDLVTATVGTATFLYATRPLGAGIAVFELGPGTAITPRGSLADSAALYAGGITALVAARVGSESYLIAGSRDENGIQVFRIAADGSLAATGRAGPTEGVPVAGVSALRLVELAGETFVVAAAAGSSSLTVLRLGGDGTLTALDQVIDDLGSRFAGVTALDAIVVDGRAFVVAAGTDAGLSLFTLLPDGRLVHLSSLADTVGASLTGVSAIEMLRLGNELQVYVGSGAEAGLTVLRVALGTLGQVILASAATAVGTAGADLMVRAEGAGVLEGGAGDDVLVDGAGADTLRGGAGADIFVLGADGRIDTIEDVDPAADRIDLTGWPFLRNLSQLTITSTANGATITFFDEVLRLVTASGAPLTVAQAQAMVAPALTRLSLWTPDPDPDPGGGGTTVSGGAGPDTLAGGDGDETVQGLGGDDILLASPGADLLDGGEGRDRVSYEAATAGVTADLSDPEANTGAAAGDRFQSVEDLTGSALADTLRGDAGGNRLDGGSGPDRIEGRGGDDVLAGGPSNDTLLGGDGNDTLWGQSNSDWLEGGANADSIDGGAGNDTLYGGEGADTLLGADHADLLDGGDGDDRIDGGTGKDTIYGGAGADTILGFHDDDWIIPGSGADSLDGGNGIDTVDYGAETAAVGVDLLSGTGSGVAAGDRYTLIEGAVGTGFGDTLQGNAAPNRLSGGEGADRLLGDAGDDWLEGGAGGDTIHGGAGDDTLDGGSGDDLLDGQGGLARIEGGGGNDTIFGNAYADTLSGNDGDDQISGKRGADSLAGGDGADVLTGLRGADTLFGDAGDDRLDGGEDADLIDGGPGLDLLIGGTGGDWLSGGDLGDTLQGDAGDDWLSGDDGNDRLLGGEGRDTMTGGEGRDLFIFTDLGPAAFDLVTDFLPGSDRLELQGIPGDTRSEKFAALAIADAAQGDLSGASVSYGGQVIFLQGVDPDALALADFILR